MIQDRLENAERYYGLHPGFRVAFEFLKTQNLRELPLGRQEIDGTRLFVLVARDPGRGRAGAKLEAHRKYIDIQYVIAGDEVIGVQPTVECKAIAEPYNPARDIIFFADKVEKWISLPPGTFIVFFPEDAHAPLAGDGEVHKAVVKVAVDWTAK